MSKLFNHTLLVRTLSGIVFAAVMIGAVLFSPVSFFALMVVVCVGSMLEFYKIARLKGGDPAVVYACAVGVAVLAQTWTIVMGWFPVITLAVLFPAVFLLFIIELYRKSENPFANIAWAVGGIVYIAAPLALLISLPAEVSTTEYTPWIVLGIVFIVWANDVGAYLFGVALGRHKLFERISPKKSWEGFFGGVICAGAVGALIAFVMQASVGVWIGAGVVTALAGVAGDLVESMLKRSAGVKDSGAILPGHGGFLDRFDALLLAVPYVYLYFIIFTP